MTGMPLGYYDAVDLHFPKLADMVGRHEQVVVRGEDVSRRIARLPQQIYQQGALFNGRAASFKEGAQGAPVNAAASDLRHHGTDWPGRWHTGRPVQSG